MVFHLYFSKIRGHGQAPVMHKQSNNGNEAEQ